MYRLDADDNVLERDVSIYVDAFVMNGLSEYYLATSDAETAQLALGTFENTYDRLRRPGSYGIAPYALPEGMKTLGIPMIFSFFYHNLGKALGRQDVCQAGYEYATEILRDFHADDKDVVLELVSRTSPSIRRKAGLHSRP